VKVLAGLAQLKVAMGAGIFLTALIFALFLGVIILIVNEVIVTLTLDFGVILILALPLLFVLFQYLVGPTIVRMSTHLQYLKPGENPWLESTVKDLAEKSKVPMPKLAIVPDKTPNAFVFGRTAHSATLAVHEGLLRNLNEDEVRGVIGHELGHIRHKDYAIMTLLSALPLIAFLVARATWSAAWLSGGSKGKKGSDVGVVLIVIGVISFVVYFVSQLSVMRLSRLREHYSDAYSAYVTGSPRSLESALAKITYGLSLSPKPPEGVRAFYISDPAQAKQEIREIMDKRQDYDLDHDGVLNEKELELAMQKEANSNWHRVNNLFSTHPPTFKRIMLLHEIEQEMQSGKYTEDRVYTHV
jgi:heat shock protein HtpX